MSKSTAQLLEELNRRFPVYRNATKLIRLTGPRIADCLRGEIDSAACVLGNPRSHKIVEDYYNYSPISSALSTQLSKFFIRVLSYRRPDDGTIRSLEIGGGTGGTTRWAALSLIQAGNATEYTSPDISPTLVKKAKKNFALQYPRISYSTIILDSDLQAESRGKFDIFIATNTIHAITNCTAYYQRVRKTLSGTGVMVILEELTCHIDWCDICFGLLDGWWLADGPIAPLQTA